MSAFETIVSAVIDALEADPPVSPLIMRAGTRPVPESADTAVNVFFDGAVPSRSTITGAPLDWTTRVAIELYARSSTTTGDLAVSNLMSAVFARLAADATLGGLVDDIGAPSVDPVYDSQGQKTGTYRLTYPVQHRTDNNTIA